MVKRIIYPPIWLVFGLVAIFAFNELLPGIRFGGSVAQGVGGFVILIGLVLLLLAGGLFRRAGTDLIPFKTVSALVTTGIYRYTRNPMYLGMASILLGCGITVGSTLALLVTPVFMLIIDWRFIRAEEKMLVQLFPQDFPGYCTRVRRWL